MPERSRTSFRRAAVSTLVLVVTLALAGCAAAPRPSGSASTTKPPTAAEKQVVDGVNRLRKAHGLAPLAVHSTLVRKARLWSKWMAGGGCGRDASGRPQICHSDLPADVDVPWTLLEENVGAASPNTNISGINTGFAKSPHHAANILNSQITKLGIGVAYSGNIVYVTEEFMAQ